MEIERLDKTERELLAKVATLREEIDATAQQSLKKIETWLETTLLERRALLDTMKQDVATLTASAASVAVRDLHIGHGTHGNPPERAIELEVRDNGYSGVSISLGNVKPGKYRAFVFLMPLETK